MLRTVINQYKMTALQFSDSEGDSRLVLKRRAESKRAAVGKEGRVLIESECVCVGCWSEMGRGPSWLLLQRPCLPVLAHLQLVKLCSHHSGRGGTSPQLRALTTKPVAKGP